MPTSEQISFILRANRWKQQTLGDELQGDGLDGVPQWQVSRWEREKEPVPQKRIGQIEQLCYDTIVRLFQCPDGFRYICNLSDCYGDCFETREADALARLRKELIAHPPWGPSGLLQITVLSTSLPDGVRAQCFEAIHDPPRYFFLLVRDDVEWDENMRHIRDEAFAHVLGRNHGAHRDRGTSFDIKDD